MVPWCDWFMGCLFLSDPKMAPVTFLRAQPSLSLGLLQRAKFEVMKCKAHAMWWFYDGGCSGVCSSSQVWSLVGCSTSAFCCAPWLQLHQWVGVVLPLIGWTNICSGKFFSLTKLLLQKILANSSKHVKPIQFGDSIPTGPILSPSYRYL